jgi:hypothetical protein
MAGGGPTTAASASFNARSLITRSTLCINPNTKPVCRRLISREASTSANAAGGDRDVRAGTLTLLHKTRAFIPRALPSQSCSSNHEEVTVSFWEELLSAAQTKLSTPSPKPGLGPQGPGARIVGSSPFASSFVRMRAS